MGRVDVEIVEQIRAGLNESRLARLMGMEVRTLEEGRALVALQIDERLNNWIGRTHGAAVMSLAHQAVGAVAATMADPARTIQLNVNLLATPAKGEVIVATARLLHAGRRVSVFDFDVRDGSGRLLANGQATGLASGDRTGSPR